MQSLYIRTRLLGVLIRVIYASQINCFVLFVVIGWSFAPFVPFGIQSSYHLHFIECLILK